MLNQFNSASGTCRLTQFSSRTALAALLAELLFTRGGECFTTDDLLRLYQQHFGVPLLLDHFGVDTVLSLIELPEIKQIVKLVDVQMKEDSYQIKPVLSTSSLLAEQLRYLLTIHDGCLPIEQMESIYTATFGIQTHINITDLVERNKILHAAPHVVNVTGNNKWLVWAPTGRPYPSRSRKSCLQPERISQDSHMDIAASENTRASIYKSGEVMNVHATKTKNDASIVEDNELPFVSELKPHPLFPELAATRDILLDTKASSTPGTAKLKSIETPVMVSMNTNQPNAEKSVPKVDGANAKAHFIESSVDPPTSVSPSQPHLPTSGIPSQPDPPTSVIPSQPDPPISVIPLLSNPSISVSPSQSDPPTSVSPSQSDLPTSVPSQPHNGDSGELTAETYGFLEKTLEPELMAELCASGEQQQDCEQTLSELLNTRPLSEHAIQLLLHFAKPTSEFDLEEYDSDNADELEKESEPDQPVDYLASGMSPDQVLDEMRKLKERCGGYLSPDKMEPFLTYFGELSSRELDRLESLEEKEKPKPKKGATKKKRVMAIRFPEKSPAPHPPNDDDPYKEQRLYSVELLKDKLPAAPDFDNLSDSGDSDGSCPRPLEREEYIQMLLQRGIPTLTDEEIMRATQVLSSAEGNPSIDWPSFDVDSDTGTNFSDLPMPLLSTTEAGRTAARQLFDDGQFVLDRTATDSKAGEWPDLK